MLCYRGLNGEIPVMRQREKGSDCKQEPALWLLREGRDKAGRTGLGWAVLNSFSRLSGIETVPCYLVPHPRCVCLGQVNSGSECESR